MLCLWLLVTTVLSVQQTEGKPVVRTEVHHDMTTTGTSRLECQTNLVVHVQGCLTRFETFFDHYMKTEEKQVKASMALRLCRTYEESLQCLHEQLLLCPPTDQVLHLMEHLLGNIREFMFITCYKPTAQGRLPPNPTEHGADTTVQHQQQTKNTSNNRTPKHPANHPSVVRVETGRDIRQSVSYVQSPTPVTDSDAYPNSNTLLKDTEQPGQINERTSLLALCNGLDGQSRTDCLVAAYNGASLRTIYTMSWTGLIIISLLL